MTPLRIGSSPRRLEAVLSRPAAPRGAVVVCHPHPQYGGDMDNGVVVATAAALTAAGWATLRFNFGGVGESQGAYTGGAGEADDVAAAVDAVEAHVPATVPPAVVGYSFGAWVALRAVARGLQVSQLVLIGPPFDLFGWDLLAASPVVPTAVVGERDQFCDAARLAASPGLAAVRVLPGADHFFTGMERVVGAEVAALFA